MPKFAIMIDVDGDWMYVPENPTQFKQIVGNEKKINKYDIFLT